jgi:hypothetical protein
MKKKLTALLTACLVMLSVFPANVAAASTPSTKIKASCVFPDIDIEVTVPTDTSAYLNPKKVSVSAGATITDGKVVITDPSYIENKSVVPISVSASVTGTVKSRSTMTLSDHSTKGMTSKAAFVYFEMHAVDNPETESAWDSSYNASKHILVTKGTTTKENFVTIGAASQTDHYGIFRLTGDCVTDPEDNPWTSKDGFTAKIVFTFKALPLT